MARIALIAIATIWNRGPGGPWNGGAGVSRWVRGMEI